MIVILGLHRDERRIADAVADFRRGTLAWRQTIRQVIGVPREDAVFVGETVIDSDVRRLIRLPALAVIGKVVRQTGLARHRVERYQLHRHRIEAVGGNDVPRERRSATGERIVDGHAQLGKIAVAHLRGWYRYDGRLILFNAALVEIHEKKRPVRLQRPAQATAKLIEMIERLRDGKKVPRVEMLVATEVEHGSVKLIAAGLRDDVDPPAKGPAVLSRVKIGLHHDFLNRVDGRLDAHAAHDALGVVQAIDQLQV